MDKLTYIFKGDYVNRDNDKNFIRSIISKFNQEQVTGIGAKVNNNPWGVEVFIFVTIDTAYLNKDEFNSWLKSNYGEREVTHNIFLGQITMSGNILTFVDESSLSFFDILFIFSEKVVSFPDERNDILMLSSNLRSDFEKKYPQYKTTKYQTPVVFISHSSFDKTSIALPLSDYLCTKEISIWLDRNEINLDDKHNDQQLYEKIYNGISICKFGIFIVTSNFLEKSDWVKKEISICQKQNKKMLFLTFNDTSLKNKLEKLKEEFCLTEASFISISDNNYDPVIRFLRENNHL
ncbi:toll/interleukin-1 receptor domain-containing protein [Avibacterium sp. 21-586]|uniref:toll/interleukin-1 receptor domain-containing protein n=1 Tax=Avibacterium sp. 21-586 TaxID=2911534 RepID=UPI0022470E4F|nr:toll/interleukin-1 receptor domain-containing protein [Avibacterium sp. 21-586]MCW9709723.1 toll/interleukin-1 receptor domain-containing protein [Avibacterium sp. 21-586]